MNVDVAGRIRPSIRGEGPHNLQTDGHNKLASRPGAPYFLFQHLHRQDASNFDVFHRTVLPQVDLCLAGFNTCLLLAGESGSGKTYTIAGETMSKSGVVPLSIDHIFAKIGEDERYIYDKQVGEGQSLSFSMYEIYNELIRDLNQVPGAKPNYLDIAENAERGTFVKGVNRLPVSNATEGAALFRQAWARRTETYTDYGPARNHSTIVIQLDLTLQVKDSPLPNRSRMTFVVLPGAEKLVEDQSELRLREGPTLNRSLFSLGQLIAALANQQYPDRIINYGESKLTNLLREELGGNCKTRALMCFRPQSDTAVLTPLLQQCQQLVQVLNYPLLNDPFAQLLLTQCRARTLGLQKDLGYGAGLPDPSQIGDAQEELRRLQTENLGLRDQNERLHHKLEQLQGNFGSLATTKTDLSAQLLMTEEEKLKVSKTLVDMQIQNNKLKEECEATKFELTNKIMQLEHDKTELEIDRDRYAKAARDAKEKQSELDKDRKELADEYVALKTNYLSVAKAHEEEVKRGEELSMELLNLVNAKAALMRQAQTWRMAEAAEADSYYMDPDAEIDRVKAVISRLSSTRLRPADYKTSEKDRENMERSLFGNQQRFDGEVNRMRTHYDEEQHKLQRKLTSLNKDLSDARSLARERQKKISELNANLITARSDRDHLQSSVNRLQHKMKDVNEDFRSRLVKYVEDVADFIDGNSGSRKRPNPSKLRSYVDDMLKDLKRAHKIREQQLSDAAQSFKHRLQSVIVRHEELLVAYRELRELLEEKGFDDLYFGPDETQLHMSEEELTSAQEKEINRLNSLLASTQTELDSTQLRKRLDAKRPPHIDSLTRSMAENEGEKWASLRKQLREFTLNTQQDLEQERAELLTEKSILEQEVQELKDYIDIHLARYKEEIVRLRERFGIAESSGFTSPPQPHSYRNHRR